METVRWVRVFGENEKRHAAFYHVLVPPGHATSQIYFAARFDPSRTRGRPTKTTMSEILATVPETAMGRPGGRFWVTNEA